MQIYLFAVEDLMRRTGAKINIPPMHANNEMIIINGEREGVEVSFIGSILSLDFKIFTKTLNFWR
jgi:hypothetical protein